MTLDERLAYFSEQVNCVRPIYTWQYGSTGQLLKSNCPCEAVLDTALSIFNGKKDLASLAAWQPGVVLLSWARPSGWSGWPTVSGTATSRSAPSSWDRCSPPRYRWTASTPC